MKRALKIIGTILSLLLLTILILWKLDFIRFGKAVFEKKEQINVVNNSTYETIEHFIKNGDFGKYKGKVIFFNSWATWCGPCKTEIPLLNDISEKYKVDTNIVFLSYCSNALAKDIDSILNEDELKLKFNKIDANNGLRMSLLKIAVEQNNYKNVDTTKDLVPMNLIINKQGKIIYYHSGFDKSELINIYKIINEQLK
jgi:thiol-disulfide isomerase/thioredoxin